MIFFPDRTVVHPDEVVERVKREFPKKAGGPEPCDAVDRASRDSFPASDPPPWTLGCTGRPVRSAEA